MHAVLTQNYLALAAFGLVSAVKPISLRKPTSLCEAARQREMPQCKQRGSPGIASPPAPSPYLLV